MGILSQKTVRSVCIRDRVSEIETRDKIVSGFTEIKLAVCQKPTEVGEVVSGGESSGMQWTQNLMTGMNSLKFWIETGKTTIIYFVFILKLKEMLKKVSTLVAITNDCQDDRRE